MKKLKWEGSSRKDLKKLPEQVIKDIGTDLMYVQYGKTPSSAKALSDGVMELVVNFSKETYRGVYIAKLGDFALFP